MTSPSATNLDVDPEGLAAVGRGIADEGDALAVAVGTLSEALSSGAQPGHDIAGFAFAAEYLRSGVAVLSAAEASVNACRNVAFGIGMSAANYSRAEAASTPGGGGSALPAPAGPTKFSAPGMPSPYGPGVAEPILWTIVEAFVGGAWPDGDAGQLRAAATAWDTFGTAISTGSAEIERAFGELVIHTIPERDAMLASLKTMANDFLGVGTQCGVVAGQLRGFADEVQTTQHAIRDVLHRMSPSGLLSGIAGVFRGDNPWDDIKAAARDIQTILHHLKRESDSRNAIFQQGMGTLDQIVTNAEGLVRKEFVDWFGEDVGNAAANVVNGVIDVGYGVDKRIVNTVYGLGQLLSTNALVDPQGAANNVRGVLEGVSLGVPLAVPARLLFDYDHTVAQLKGLIDYDEWNSDHPLRGLGANIVDVGSVLIPGGAGAAAKAGTAARVEGEAAGSSAAARGAVKDGASAVAHAAGGGEVAAQAGKLADDLNAIKPPETHAPTAQPGPSTLPESRAPIDPSPTHDPAPTNDPKPQSSDPAPHTPEPPPSRHAEPPLAGTPEATPHSPHSGDNPTPATHDPGLSHTPTHETPAPPTHEHAPSASNTPEPAPHNIDPPVTTYPPEAPQAASSLNDAFVAGHPTTELAQQVADYSTHHVPAPVGGDPALADRVVLGKWDGQDGGYIGEARHHGGIYFDTGGDTWAAVERGLSPERAQSVGWQVNEQFLRTQMESHVGRIDYLLDHGKYSTLEEMAMDRAGSFSSMEVEFLKDNAAAYGYQRVGDSWIYTGGK